MYWGLGIGDWGLGPIPNPQSPIPNPQSPIKNSILYYIINNTHTIIYLILCYKRELINFYIHTIIVNKFKQQN